MYEFPVKVTITIPSRITPHYGRESTTAPYGTIVSVRLPNAEVETIDRARQIIGFDISRGGFIRLAGYRCALEICKHHDEFLQQTRGSA
jgi:hypothetical protein